MNILKPVGVSLGLGAVTYVSSSLLFGALTPSMAEVNTAVRTCSQQLGAVAVTADQLPAACDNLETSFDKHITTTTDMSGDEVSSTELVEYELPSAAAFNDAYLLTAQDQKKTDALKREAALVASGVMIVIKLLTSDFKGRRQEDADRSSDIVSISTVPPLD